CWRLPVPNLQSLRSWASSMLSPLASINVFMFSFHVNFGLPLFLLLYFRIWNCLKLYEMCIYETLFTMVT
ncbi:hypothetical protein L9F63_002218, partial [Diploptera punctata]